MIIGLLLPRSVLYPALAFDITDGLKASLKKLGLEGRHNIISDSIGIAGKNEEIYAKCEQLLIQGADIIIGYMNPASAEFIHPLFESSGKQLLVMDSGYHFPDFKEKLPNAWFITLQGNLLCRAIVKKALEDGYENFAFTCSFYDAGYRPSYSYFAAVEEKGLQMGFSHITPLLKSEFSLEPLLSHLENNPQTAVFASFCGDMTEDFFREAANHPVIGSSKIYASGFTAEEEWLAKIPYPGFNWECAVAWSNEIGTPENIEFKLAMNGIREHKANLFSLLAWEAGQFIAAADGKSFDNITIESPRGAVYMDPDTGFTESPIYYANVVKNTVTANCLLTNVKKTVDLDTERKRLRDDIDYLQSITANSWFNAYACLDS